MKTKSKKQKAETSFPKSRMLQFEKESFLCDNGGHDCGVVYRHRGKWLCGPCLKDAVRKNGGTSVEAYSATWRAERRMVAGHMRCLTPKIERPLFKTRDFHQKKVVDPDCDWCDGKGCEECLAESL